MSDTPKPDEPLPEWWNRLSSEDRATLQRIMGDSWRPSGKDDIAQMFAQTRSRIREIEQRALKNCVAMMTTSNSNMQANNADRRLQLAALRMRRGKTRTLERYGQARRRILVPRGAMSSLKALETRGGDHEGPG